MAFKDLIATDKTNVFLDFEAFGETHTINGKEIIIVIDDDELRTRQGSQELSIDESTTLFYCNEKDFPGVYPGQTINYDHRICLIDDISNDLGILTVALHENIGR